MWVIESLQPHALTAMRNLYASEVDRVSERIDTAYGPQSERAILPEPEDVAVALEEVCGSERL